MPSLTHRDFLKLCLAAPLAATPAGARAGDWSIAWGDERQVIDGFGISGAFHQCGPLRGFAAEKQAALLDLLFSPGKGAGFSIIRNAVGDGGTWGSPQDGPTPTIEPHPGVWNWRGDEDQVWFMREAAARGCTRFVSTVWSPPAWMKTNGNVSGGGRLKPDCYRAFAEYLAAYVEGYKAHHGLDIYAVSPANEPEMVTKYSSCEWSGEELHRLVRDHIVPVFAERRVPAKLILGEHSTWSEEPYRPALADPVAASRVDIVATHGYTAVNKGFEPVAERCGPLPAARRRNKRVWQTEVSAFDKNQTGMEDGLYWARVLHAHLVDCEVNAWFYWWAVNARDTRSGLIRIFPQSQDWVAAKRFFTIAQFARFVRPEWRRVAVRMSFPPGVFLSAYKDPQTSRRAVVAINENARSIPVMFPAGVSQAAVWRTSATEDLADCGSLRAQNGNIRAVLTPKSVTTIVLHEA